MYRRDEGVKSGTRESGMSELGVPEFGLSESALRETGILRVRDESLRLREH